MKAHAEIARAGHLAKLTAQGMRLARACAFIFLITLLAGADSGASASPIDMVALIRELGFPIFVTIWFMTRIEKRLDRFASAVEQLTTVVTVIEKIVDKLPGGPGTGIPLPLPPTETGPVRR